MENPADPEMSKAEMIKLISNLDKVVKDLR